MLHLAQGSPDTKETSTPSQTNQKNVRGHFVQLWTLIDQRFQNSFETGEAVKPSGIKREHTNIVISGTGSSTRKYYGQISLNTG